MPRVTRPELSIRRNHIGQAACVEITRTGRDEVTARLSSAEAFVLFDMLHEWENGGGGRLAEVAGDAERRVLSDLSASLEPVIDEVFSANYASGAGARA
jgi:hypothetical protein